MRPPYDGPPRGAWQPPARPRRRYRVSRLGGLIVLCVLMVAAGYHYSPFADIDLPSFRGLAKPETAARSFAICGTGPRVNCVVDGDTFYLAGEKIRIADIDTPELFSPQCGRERALAVQAQRRLHTLLNAGPVSLRRGLRDEDVYGRKLRTVHRDGRSLGAVLVAEGLAHKWRGYKRSWCG